MADGAAGVEGFAVEGEAARQEAALLIGSEPRVAEQVAVFGHPANLGRGKRRPAMEANDLPTELHGRRGSGHRTTPLRVGSGYGTEPDMGAAPEEAKTKGDGGFSWAAD